MVFPFSKPGQSEHEKAVDTPNKTAVELAFETLRDAKDAVLQRHEAWLSKKNQFDEIKALEKSQRDKAEALDGEIFALVRSGHTDAQERIAELSGQHGAALALAHHYQRYAQDLEPELEEAALDTAVAYAKYDHAGDSAITLYSEVLLSEALAKSEFFNGDFLKAAKLRVLASANRARQLNAVRLDDVSAFDLVVNEILDGLKKELSKKLKNTALCADETPELVLLLGVVKIHSEAIKDFESPAAMTKRRHALQARCGQDAA